MSGASDTIRKIAFLGFAIVAVVCVAASFQYRNEILGGFALRGAQSSFEERVRRDIGPDARIDYAESSERSAQLVISVPQADCPDDVAVADILDTVWVAYAEEFIAGGMPIDSVVVTADLSSGEASGAEMPQTATPAELAGRTGVPAPPLHPMYAEKDYFDPSKEGGPAGAATDE